MNQVMEQLQRQFREFADTRVNAEFHDHLSILEVAGQLHIDFCGSPFDEPFNYLCSSLARTEIASVIGSLSLRSHSDLGVNGTRNWDLWMLVHGAVVFPNLRSFSVEQNNPDGQNRVIVGADYDESGVLGRLLRKSPALEKLTVPSAPDRSFFELKSHPLRFLNVDAGYDTQDFIGNLAASSCFPNLTTFEFGEFNETYLDDFQASCTPFDDYRRLFMSEAFSRVKMFVWRNPVCSESEMMKLRPLRSKGVLQIKIVQFSSRYL